MQRWIIAFLSTPLIATAFMGVHDLAQGAGFIPVSAYLFVTYALSVFPGILIVFVMHKTCLNKLWHFGGAGLVLAVLGVGIILGKIPIVQISLGVWLDFLGQFWVTLVTGILAGVYFGLVSGVTTN